MRVLIGAGGTAGHVNPGLAIAEIIMREQPDSVIEFVCSEEKSDKAAELVPKAGFALHRIKVLGGSSNIIRKARAFFYMKTSPSEGKKLIRSFKPDLIIGTGGYTCWPICKAGTLMGIPTVLHESNAIPGLAVRMLKNDVQKILVNFPQTAEALGNSERVSVVGNPFSDGFRIATRGDSLKAVGIKPGQKYVLCFGGSGGAEVFNQGVIQTLADIAKARTDTVFALATGKARYGTVTALAREKGVDTLENVRIYDYIYNMPEHMAAADVVICRAGAMTLSEVALTSKAAIIVPSPNVANNHQYKNAKAIADADAGILVEEKDFENNALKNALTELLDSTEKRAKLGESIHGKFASPDANRVIYREIVKLVK